MSEPEVNAAPAQSGAGSIRQRIISGTIWTIIGYGSQSIFRFASNVILTRILVPSAFGLMTLTNIFILGLELLSDVGVGPAIIHSPRGDERELLDTAWTVQIIRGMVLCLIALVVAWPASKYYREPTLAPLIAVAGFGMIIRGFTPTRVHTLSRKVILGRLTAMELSCQVFALVVTAVASYLLKSVWGLLIGKLGGDMMRVIVSFLILPGHRHRLLLDRGALKEIVHVGRWIIIGTALMYAAGNLDRLVMGRVLTVRDVGIYSIAFQMVTAVTGLGRSFGSRVMFPAFAEAARVSSDALYPRLRKARLLWTVPTSVVLIAMTIWGDLIIKLLYKPEYQAAGWMVRILAAGSIVASVNQAIEAIWPALGKFRTTTLLLAVHVPLLLVGLYIGGTYFGVVGYVVAVAAVELPLVPLQFYLVWRRGLFQPEVDVTVLVASAVLVALGVWLR